MAGTYHGGSNTLIVGEQCCANYLPFSRSVMSVATEAFGGAGMLQDELYTKLLSMSDDDYVDPTLLHQVVNGKSCLSLTEALQIEPWALPARDICGMTPLHWAIRNGNLEAVRVLINFGADPNSKDLDGKTPLHRAAWHNTVDCANALLEAGANANAKNYFGMSPLVLAMRRGWCEIAENLLSHGADVNSLWASNTVSLGYFTNSRWQDVEAMKKAWTHVVSHGGDLNIVDASGRALVQQSVCDDNSAALRIFHQLGARLDVLLSDGRTLLHLAARYATSDIFKVLREAQINGLSTHAVDEYEDTARDDLEWRISVAEEDLPPGVKKLTEEDIAEFEALFRDLEERYNERHGVTEVDESDDGGEEGTDAESEAGWETASEGEAEGSGSAEQI